MSEAMQAKSNPRRHKSRAKQKPVIHETGPKGARDRARAVQHYLEAAQFFKERPAKGKDLALMTNSQIYRMGEDLFNRQSFIKKDEYFQYLGLRPRKNPKAIRWFIRDTIAFYQPRTDAERLIYSVLAVSRFIKRRIFKSPANKIKIQPQEPAKTA